VFVGFCLENGFDLFAKKIISQSVKDTAHLTPSHKGMQLFESCLREIIRRVDLGESVPALPSCHPPTRFRFRTTVESTDQLSEGGGECYSMLFI